MSVDQIEHVLTLGELKRQKYKSRSIKQELRDNLICMLSRKEQIFPEILGFENTVLPDLQRAILSKHNIVLLGLRGQAKTRIARLLVNLLDEYIPVIKGSELNDDPLNPVSVFARELIKEQGKNTPIEWLHRSERYAEKLATPDVSVADLIGDVDPIKAASQKLSYSDERVIHFGLIPRSHRSIFVINELPDLQARIQVALFNILQEGDIQIRGFKLRLPLDIQFMFTANPEDYTNRGSIVTPLKDRIESQILTHYPKNLEIAKQITKQEANVNKNQDNIVKVPELARELIEQIAFEARDSEYVDQRSGVSARLTITAYENLKSAAERRALITGEDKTFIRISDFWGVIPAITGKIELVYEGEQEGPLNVARFLISKAIRGLFPVYFPNPENFRKNRKSNPYQKIVDWFGAGNELEILNDTDNSTYKKELRKIAGLKDIIDKFWSARDEDEKLFMMEFVLHGLVEFSFLSKHLLDSGLKFKDLLGGMFSFTEESEKENRSSESDFNQ